MPINFLSVDLKGGKSPEKQHSQMHACIYTHRSKSIQHPQLLVKVTRTLGVNNSHNNITSDSIVLMYISEHAVYNMQ